MAAGDYQFEVTEARFTIGEGATIEYRFGIEAKDGTVPESRCDTLSIPKASLTATEKNALQTLAASFKARVKAGVEKLTGALDLA